nr:MAG TPA: Terminase [Caudoviricetes sp.]
MNYTWSYSEKTLKSYKERQKKNKKYYSLVKVLGEESIYNLIYGERSNGKSFAVDELGVIDYWENGNAMAIIRRWDTDFIGKRGQEVFNGLIQNDVIKEVTKGKWTSVKYESSRWYFAKYDEELGKVIKDVEPFCYAFALNIAEHYKSLNFPKIKTILFDEFLTRKSYLPNEFVEFMNVLSTIIRDRDNARIFMLGNTVNKYCPYFAEMGLTDIENMRVGDLRTYQLGESETTITVNYSDKPIKAKKSDKYFAFNNPKLKMITSGAWEIDIYPHLLQKYEEKDVLSKFFICFNRTILQCNIILKNNMFIYIHQKTTPLKYPEEEIIYSPEYDVRPNWHRKLNKANDKYSKMIRMLFNEDRVFYSTNDMGEVVMNYMKWCSIN